MPEVTVEIGGRSFQIACQPGEEAGVAQASDLLDREAQAVQGALGRIPEARMLLMSGLMLADRTTEIAQKLEAAEAQIAQLEADLRATKTKAAQAAQAEASGQPGAREMAAALDIIRTAADRAEALADSR